MSNEYYVEPLIYNNRPYGKVPPLYTEDPYEENNYYCEKTKLKKTPKVSIGVLAYKNIEQTKKCVESIIRYVGTLDYELILLDNGSEDNNETLEYFQTVPCINKKIIQVTEPVGVYYGCIFGTNLLIDHSCGDIFILISNDVVITENSLQNMVQCMESDDKIGIVVPMMSNAYMFQDPGLTFVNDEDMFEKAKQFNKYDPKKWEEKLCYAGPIAAYKKEALFFVGKYTMLAEWNISDRMLFSGYKVMLMGDTWVHHDHDYNNKRNHGWTVDSEYQRCRNKILDHLSGGLGLFEDIITFEMELTSMVVDLKVEPYIPEIFSIDVKSGQGLLDLKNRLRNFGIFQTKSVSFLTDYKYHKYISSVCDEMIIDRIDYLEEDVQNKKFDYIIIGNPINLYRDPIKLLDIVIRHLNPDGQLLFKLRNTSDFNALLKIIGNIDSVDNDKPVHISFEDIEKYLESIGINSVTRKSTSWNISQELVNNLASVVAHASGNANFLENKVSNILTKDYLYCVRI